MQDEVRQGGHTLAKLTVGLFPGRLYKLVQGLAVASTIYTFDLHREAPWGLFRRQFALLPPAGGSGVSGNQDASA